MSETDELFEQMEQNPELYAEEELITPVNDFLTINPETLEIHVPDSEVIFGVYKDHDAARKYFKCPKIVQDNLDLSKCHIFINYVSASGKEGQYMCEDVAATEDSDYVTFSWELKRNVFDANKDANIFFSVQAKQIEGDRVFGTCKAQGKCHENVDATEQITEEYADVILQIIERLDNVTEISPEQIAEAVENYFVENPITSEDVGADASGTAVTKVGEHNVSEDAHNDIRLLLKGLSDRVNTILDSDDTTLDQMSEIVTYIKSNKSLIDAITTNKVSVGDIIDNLTTNVANKPLSAAQGVILKQMIEAIVVPEQLPNPHKLSINVGGTVVEYDGSGAVTVTIPESGKTERIEKASTDTVVELQPNKLYIFPEMETLTYTLAQTDNAVAEEFHFIFQSGENPCEVVHPSGINIGNLTVEANEIYEISVMENMLTSQNWSVS